MSAELEYRHYLSFDCGNVSLGYSIFKIPCIITTAADATGYINPANIGITRIAEGVIDVLEGSKLSDTAPIWRARQLCKHLGTIDITKLPPDTYILIEYQMGPNVKSHSVFDGIVMYYAPLFANIITVGPSLKNRIHFSENGAHSLFLPRYARSYDANKAHSAFNFDVIATTLKWPITVPRALYKDVGDALLQGVAWHYLAQVAPTPKPRAKSRNPRTSADDLIICRIKKILI